MRIRLWNRLRTLRRPLLHLKRRIWGNLSLLWAPKQLDALILGAFRSKKTLTEAEILAAVQQTLPHTPRRSVLLFTVGERLVDLRQESFLLQHGAYTLTSKGRALLEDRQDTDDEAYSLA